MSDFFLKRNRGRPSRYVGFKNLSQIHVRIHKPVKKKVCNRKTRPSLWVPHWMLELWEILTEAYETESAWAWLSPAICITLLPTANDNPATDYHRQYLIQGRVVEQCVGPLNLFYVGSRGVFECSKYRLMAVLQKVYCCIVLWWKCYRENPNRVQFLMQ